MDRPKLRILFLAKDKPFAKEAAELLAGQGIEEIIFFGDIGDPFPASAIGKTYEYVISYISPWIVPKSVLDSAKSAINFHPGPPEYPGIGCTNFALYNQEKEFGITVHHMVEKVDSGTIITTERFPIFPGESVYSLTQRCYAYIHIAFLKLLPRILSGEALPENGDKWKRRPFTRRELDELCRLTLDMNESEVKRRIRATSYPGMPGAYIEIGGYRFTLNSEPFKVTDTPK